MSAPSNFQFVKKQAYDLDKKTIAAAHTVKTGTVANRLRFENPMVFSDPSADATVTLGDGSYIGQMQYFVMDSNTDSKTITLSVTNHETSDPEEFTFDAVDEALLLIWNGTEWHTVQSSGVST